MQSFVSCLMHCVFATKQRQPWLKQDLQERLWPYLAGIALENRMKTLAVGGVVDHVHILVSIPSTVSVAKAMRLLKGNSSKWIHETFPSLHPFGWQDGYGAFSVGVSGVDDTIRYTQNQAIHHQKISFRDEVRAFLVKHGIAFDPAMLD